VVVDLDRGKVRAEQALDAGTNSSPLYFGDLVVVGSGRGRVRGLRVRRGRLRGVRIKKLWEAAVGSDVSSSPSAAGQRIFIHSAAGHVLCLDATDGAVRWKLDVGGVRAATGPGGVRLAAEHFLDSTAAVHDGNLFLGAGAEVVALGLNGSIRWRAEAGSTVASSPAVAYGLVFVGTMGGEVLALDESNGRRVWKHDMRASVLSSPTVADGYLLVGANNGTVHQLDAFSGESVWSFPTGGAVVASPAVYDGMLFVAAQDGTVYAFG
jgi:outer membrane protein assembly factor BamB